MRAHKHIGPTAVSVLIGAALGLALPHVYGAAAGPIATSDSTMPPSKPAVTQSNPITEDDSRWNCLTMGNHKCGPTWIRLTAADSAATNAGLHMHRDWTRCVRDSESEFTACADGTVFNGDWQVQR